jgi:hypothetical protein
MRKVAISLFLVAFLLGGSYITLAYTGAIQSPLCTVSEYPMSKELDITCLSSILNEDLYGMIKKLDIHAYGINDVPADVILSWYEQKNAEDGWFPYEKDTMWKDLSDPCIIQYRMWKKYLKGQIVVCCSDDIVQSITGYDTIIITSCAPLYSYNDARSTLDYELFPSVLNIG